jgi:hypothetical protein
MNTDTTWRISMQTPLGSQAATLHLSTKGSALTGTLESRLGSGPLSNGAVDGSTLTWTAAMRFPAPCTAEFHATITGDTISGHAKLGSFGNAPFKGALAAQTEGRARL